jgi:predicted small lipoprotein YifL
VLRGRRALTQCVALAILVALTACGDDDRPYGKLYLPDPSNVREDSLARVRWAETARWRYLERVTRTAANKANAFAATSCEVQHIWKVYGTTEGDRALHEAIRAVHQTPADRVGETQLRKGLAAAYMIRMFSEAQCDSARATWPPLDPASDPYPTSGVTYIR